MKFDPSELCDIFIGVLKVLLSLRLDVADMQVLRSNC